MNAVAIDPHTLGLRALTEARRDVERPMEEAVEAARNQPADNDCHRERTRTATADQVDSKLATLYGRSVHELVRIGPPAVELEPHLRAAIGTTNDRDFGQVEKAIAELQRFANDYLQLESLVQAQAFQSFPSEVVVPKWSAVEFANDVALRERARLNLGDQPVGDLRRLLENAVGLRIFLGSAPSNVAGLYAHVASLGYCVLINAKHPRERQRWTLAHEYWHFLADRHKPGIDYTSAYERVPQTEKCADAFARSFLMPETALRRQFFDVMTNRGDFQVADLVRMSVCFGVSVQAMTLRLEGLGLVSKGTWDHLQEDGFKPESAKRHLQIEVGSLPAEPYPERYKYLAVAAYSEGKLSEGGTGKSY